jgi:hypothetical protein
VAKAEAQGQSGHLSRCTCMSACVGVCAREARSDAADKEVEGVVTLWWGEGGVAVRRL